MSEVIDTSDHSKPNKGFEADKIAFVGRTYWEFTIVAAWPYRSKYSDKMLLCRCSCGVEKTVALHNLTKAAPTKSCGCKQPIKKTHGLSTTPEYFAWLNMNHRCYHPSDVSYKYYGAIGIQVCPEWRDSFETFLIDMGERPSSLHSLDRMDNDGHYFKENCRWATDEEQKNNRSDNYFIELNGHRKTIAQWAKLAGINRHTLRGRLNKSGMTEIEAIKKNASADFIKEYFNE